MPAAERLNYLDFLRRHPFWWLLPPVLLYGALALLIFCGNDSGVAGFVYKV